MRVGVTENPPWVRLGRRGPTGIEPVLVRRLARSLGARVEWVEGSESKLMAALHEREIDLVVAGLTRKDSPWEDRAAITTDEDLTRRVAQLRQSLEGLDWKLHDVVVVPVPTLEAGTPPGEADAAASGAQSASRA